MKWFSQNGYFVVVIEKGDIYGSSSTFEHTREEPDIRIFDHEALVNHQHSYQLLAHIRYFNLQEAARRNSPLELKNGDKISAKVTAAIYEYIHSLLHNSGYLRSVA